MVMGMESSDEVAMFYLEQELERGKIMTRDQIFEFIDKVTENDILRVASDVFTPDKLNLAIIGPGQNKAKLEKLLRMGI
jgi:predicted Zn-dependent peptidase